MSQSQIQMSVAQSWVDAFTLLKHYAEAQRGKLTIGFGPGCEISWPRTTGRDVMAISAVFDGPLRAAAPAALVERWTQETDLLMNEPAEMRGEQYIGNRSFWLTLVAVAVELTARGVPLPPVENWHAAIAELAAARAPVRNAETSVVLSMFVEPTWEQMAARQLEFFRALRGERRAPTGALRSVPLTSNGDVLQLAMYWTEQLSLLGDNPTDTEHRLAYSRWDDAIERVIREAKHAPPEATYAHNPEFWSALALLADSDAFNAAPSRWAFALPATRQTPPRNADAAATEGTLVLPVAKRWDDTFAMQRDLLVNLRGADEVTDGLLHRIPRTTNDDVRQLAKFWQEGRARAGDKSFADRALTGLRTLFGDTADHDVGASHVFKVWDAALASVTNLPASAPPGDLYSRNTEFWQALASLSSQIATTSEAPRESKLAIEGLKHGVAALPDTLTSVLDALSDAGNKLVTKALAKPLLYLGAGVAGVVVLYLVFRPKVSTVAARAIP